ncbi:TPA: anion permease, partial [Streptococcus equi subsp. equi]|nr:anion permease [Streptococcus equi subsp. equi]
RNNHIKWIFTMLPLFVSVLPFISNIEKVFILILISIFLLASNIIPAWYTSILFMTACMIGNIAEKQVILSGITSGAAWLVISGVIIGAAVKHTELDRLLARFFIPVCMGKYSKVLFGTILLGVVLIFLMPSAMGRVVLLLPILNALSLELGYEKGSKEWEGIVMSGVLATYIPAFYVLPSNVPNNVFTGAILSLYSINISYSRYFLLYFPILGVGKILILYFTMRLFYRRCKDSICVSKKAIDITKEQKLLIVLLFITLSFWMTEHIHKVPTGWTGMATALIVMLPNSNFMEKQPLRKINFEPFFYVAGIISLGNIAKSSGLANVIAVHLINIVSLETASAFNVLTFFVVLCIILGFIVTLPGVPAVVTPLIDNISGVSNVSKTFLCHIEVIGFSSVFFPFQAPPLMVVLQNENLSKARMTIYCSIVSAIGLLLLLPLALYWKML